MVKRNPQSRQYLNAEKEENKVPALVTHKSIEFACNLIAAEFENFEKFRWALYLEHFHLNRTVYPP